MKSLDDMIEEEAERAAGDLLTLLLLQHDNPWLARRFLEAVVRVIQRQLDDAG